jgi:hypothetical protein
MIEKRTHIIKPNMKESGITTKNMKGPISLKKSICECSGIKANDEGSKNNSSIYNIIYETKVIT